MKYLGLDLGGKRIGVAVGETLAGELTTLKAKDGENYYSLEGQSRAFEQIRQLLDSENASAIVIGLPVNESGQPTEESVKIEKFAQALRETLNIEVHFVDETLTSFMARDMLESQGVSPAEIDARLDQLSAQLILQQYLEENIPN